MIMHKVKTINSPNTKAKSGREYEWKWKLPKRDAVERKRSDSGARQRRGRGEHEQVPTRWYCGWTSNRTMFFQWPNKFFPGPNVGCVGPAKKNNLTRNRKFARKTKCTFSIVLLFGRFDPPSFFSCRTKTCLWPDIGTRRSDIGHRKFFQKHGKNIVLFDVHPR